MKGTSLGDFVDYLGVLDVPSGDHYGCSSFQYSIGVDLCYFRVVMVRDRSWEGDESSFRLMPGIDGWTS